MRSIALLLTLALTQLSCSAASDDSPFFSKVVGTQTIGVKYKFTDEGALVETARVIQEMGSDLLKISVSPDYESHYMMAGDPKIKTALDLIQHQPEFAQVLDMPFQHIMLWVYPFSDKKSGFFKGEIPEVEAQGIYSEIYDVTAYLLKKYTGSGKSFFIGNWEGDWHMLKEEYNYDLDPTPASIQGTIDWFNLRQKAIADAVQATPHHDVNVYYYIELNHVRKSIENDRPTIVNKVLPYIKTDYVSWSSYDVTTEAAKLGGEEGKKRVMDALDYIERHLPESDISGRRVFVGEYGFNLEQVANAAEQEECARRIMQWSLEWGCPFVLYWELYCNEIEKSTGEHRGFWLIDKDGEKQPAWYLHQNFLNKADQFLEHFQKEHGRLPRQNEYNMEAVTWFQELN